MGKLPPQSQEEAFDEEDALLYAESTLHEEQSEQMLWPEDLFDLITTPSSVISLGHDPCPGVADDALLPEQVLERYWGYTSFRPLQRELITSILDGKDTLGLLPTGGGKSIIFQVPGLMLPGLTLVITPLISLMKDQVDRLHTQGIRATAIHSGMSQEKIQVALDNCLYGRYKFLYISPERLGSPLFRSWLSELAISLIVVDECHCMCQWGYDFRPSYLEILSVRHELEGVPILALTATATEEVVEDIIRALEFRPGYTYLKKSFHRPNLSYSIRRSEDKTAMMLHILSRVSGSAIVYCRDRELTRKVTDELLSYGISATYYHAGLTYKERELRQARWMRDEVRVMVATNAFGMGIDKPNVRLVIHLTVPSSLEEYFQEAGRAGRDGEKSYAVMITSGIDSQLLTKRLRDTFPDKDYIRHIYDQMCNFLSIGEGEGLGRTYDFDIDLFIRRFRMRPVQTRYAIEIMQLSGWLEYNDDDSRSRLMFLVPSSRLYEKSVRPDSLIRALLRSYTGLFSGYVTINEGDLSELTGYTNEEVYLFLVDLTMKGILHYIPQKHVPRVSFRIRREDSRLLTIPYAAYTQRQERMSDRIGAVRTYIEEENTCRSRMLLAYFGEQDSAPCGACDVCLRKHPTGLTQHLVDEVKEELDKRLLSAETDSYPIETFVSSLPFHPLDTVKAIRFWAGELGEVFHIRGDQLCKIKVGDPLK